MRVKVISSSTSIVWRWWILAIGVATADQSAKLAVSTLMPYGQSIPLTAELSSICPQGQERAGG